MKTVLHHWNTFWFAKTHPGSLAVIRIALGAFLIVYWFSYFQAVPSLFSTNGLVIPHGDWVPILDVIPSYALYCVLLYCCIAFFLGWKLRFHGTILLCLLLYYYALSFHAYPSTYNRYLVLTVFLLTYGGADNAFSIKMHKEKGSWSAWEYISAWPIRILSIHLVLLYLAAGLQKSVLSDWNSGDMIRQSFTGRWATPYAFWTAKHISTQLFYDIIRDATQYVHLFIAFGLPLPKFRVPAVILASGFHMSVAFFLGMWWFLVLIPLYLVFFNPERVYAHAKKLFLIP